MKNWGKFITVITVLGLMSGCVEPLTPQQVIAKSADKQMASTFLKKGILPKKEKLYDWSPSDIIQTRRALQTVTSDISDAIRSYNSKYDSSTDTIARLFIKTARARGNKVKLYKNSVNNAIAPFVPAGSYANISIKKFNLDPAFIEFDKSGRVVSILVRRHYFPSINNRGLYSHDRDSLILLGKFAKKIEMLVGNETLSNGYVSTL